MTTWEGDKETDKEQELIAKQSKIKVPCEDWKM